MGMNFAILKKIKGDETQVFEYDESILSERIPRLVLEMLPLQTVFKRKYSREEIEIAAKKAWVVLKKEFREETIKLK